MEVVTNNMRGRLLSTWTRNIHQVILYTFKTKTSLEESRGLQSGDGLSGVAQARGLRRQERRNLPPYEAQLRELGRAGQRRWLWAARDCEGGLGSQWVQTGTGRRSRSLGRSCSRKN